MLHKDQILKIEKLLRDFGLGYDGRHLLSRKNIQSVMSSIKDDIDPNDKTNISLLLPNFKIDKYKSSFLTKHQKQFPNNILFYLDKNQLFVNNSFFKIIVDEEQEYLKSEKLSDEEQSDDEQGFIYFSPKSEYTNTMLKFEDAFRDNSFQDNKIKIKNVKNFSKIEKITDLTINTNYPKLLRVSIEIDRTIKGISKPLYYELQKGDYIYECSATELELMSAKTIRPIDNMDEDAPKIPVSVLKQNSSGSVQYYVYDCVVHGLDGDKQKMLLESFIPLRTTYYECYGYVRKGISSNLLHLKLIKLIEEKNSNVSEKDIFIDTKTHRFNQMHNFVFDHIKKNGLKLLKKKSDTLIWLEVLKILVQFGGFDPNKRVHTLFAGLQDVGKSYILEIFNNIKFTNIRIVSSRQLSGPGLFGGSNQNVQLPDENIHNVSVPGAMSTDVVIIEEIGRALSDPKSIFNENIEDLQLALYRLESDNVKLNGGKQPRTASLCMTMNYDTARKLFLRKELLRIAESIESDWKYNKISLGEKTKNLLDSDEAHIQSSILRELIMKKDIFVSLDNFKEVEYFDEELQKQIPELDALAFKKSIETYREQYKADAKDINTGLPYPFMKRILYSLYGSLNETKVEKSKKEIETEIQTKEYERGDVSRLKTMRSLYIPNLRELLCNIITTNAKNQGYHSDNSEVVARQNFYTKQLYFIMLDKYPSLKKFGDETPKDTLSQILNTLMFLNNEEYPSLITFQLVEKWVYLQCTVITTMEAKSTIVLDRSINYFVTEENYEKLKNNLFKFR